MGLSMSVSHVFHQPSRKQATLRASTRFKANKSLHSEGSSPLDFQPRFLPSRALYPRLSLVYYHRVPRLPKCMPWLVQDTIMCQNIQYWSPTACYPEAWQTRGQAASQNGKPWENLEHLLLQGLFSLDHLSLTFPTCPGQPWAVFSIVLTEVIFGIDHRAEMTLDAIIATVILLLVLLMSLPMSTFRIPVFFKEYTFSTWFSSLLKC